MRGSGVEQAKASVKKLFASLDARFRSAAGVPTGISSLDHAGGLQAGEIAVLAGHPGVGKTSMAVSIASHAAAVQDGTVLWISLAETAEQTAERLVLHQSHVQPLALRTGKLQRQDMTNLTHAAATVSRWSFHIEDAADLTAAGIRERAREWRAASTATRALIVVDYLQLLADECDPAAVLRSLLGTAKETRSSLLLVSQQLADAHQRATLESIATAVVFLRSDVQAHEILLTKHRYCQTPQTEEVTFEGSTFTAVVESEQEIQGT